MAHLAGALGRPVWIALAQPASWLWGDTGDRTPWYPTARLFRQPAVGDWSSVVERIAAELHNLAVPFTVTAPLFTAAECDSIIGRLGMIQAERARVAAGGTTGTVNPETFAASWVMLSGDELPEGVCKRLKAAVQRADGTISSGGTDSSATGGGSIREARFIRYGVGDHFDWHRDRLDTDVDGRRLSMTIQLSDPND